MPRYDDDEDDTPQGNRPGSSCEDCKFWSELCARSIGCGMEAMCLNPDSSKYQRMTNGGCDKYEFGRAVDCPC
jgi:hypothetical protein